jgi:GSH-dependent disulfide-bond oxidoreductase
MIDLHTWTTSNGRKAFLMLEETGLPYRVVWVDIRKGDQFKPEFLAINPNNKIPAIVDRDGPDGKPYPLFESGAILMYLAEKTGRFLPQDRAGRYRVIQWLMFQMGGLGPMLGQVNHFREAKEKSPYAIERFAKEATRLYRVVDKRLGEAEYLAGDYSIADMAVFPWLQNHKKHDQKLEDYPNIRRWFAAIETRPAVQRVKTAVESAPRRVDADAAAQ